MHPSETSFSPFWWGISLDLAGLGEARPDLGTYGRYDYAALPELPVVLRGDFRWLEQADAWEGAIDSERAKENAVAVSELEFECARLGLALPEEFLTFIKSRALQMRVRSNTDCFLDICPAAVESPSGDGYLARFLADSQGCLFWYLFLPKRGQGHAIVVSPDFYGTPEEQWQEEAVAPEGIAFCAESFESFVCRFWIENELWFAAYEEQPPHPWAAAYAAAYIEGRR
ncbi:MAG: hypothetical protein E6Q88_03490 [Lysobacteraceae bacterium]|nr:MAG: hypothetical protein E6Q88_03490 [Xanthomonadaceae bacterium]